MWVRRLVMRDGYLYVERVRCDGPTLADAYARLGRVYERLGQAIETATVAFEDLLEASIPYEPYRAGSMPKDKRLR